MKIIAIIQARVGSTRLPGKVLLKLGDKTVLEHVVDRVRSSNLVDDVVVATTIDENDKEIVKLCDNVGVNVYRGSISDVLDRYYNAAKYFSADHIVRITADCPMMDSQVVDSVISLHLKENADYTSNTIKETFPDGLDVEVFTMKALESAWKNAVLLSEREHVTPYIRKSKEFKLVNFSCHTDLSDKRWTIDNEEDYQFMKLVFENVYTKKPSFEMKDVLSYISSNPDVEKLNSHISRNEGYKKSLQGDHNV